MNRRSFLKVLGVTAAGFAVPELILPPEPENRFWALDRTMMGKPDFITLTMEDQRFFNFFAEPVETRYDIQTATFNCTPEFREEMERAMLKARMELDRALLYGEVDTPIGKMVMNRYDWGRVN